MQDYCNRRQSESESVHEKERERERSTELHSSGIRGKRVFQPWLGYWKSTGGHCQRDREGRVEGVSVIGYLCLLIAA